MRPDGWISTLHTPTVTLNDHGSVGIVVANVATGPRSGLGAVSWSCAATDVTAIAITIIANAIVARSVVLILWFLPLVSRYTTPSQVHGCRL